MSTDPEFTRKAADIVALYLDPLENALVLSVDEKLAIKALERAQGWLRLPGGEAVRGFNHPTHASWLNQVECWFSILWRQDLRGLSTNSVHNLCKAIGNFSQAYNENATPFEWT